MRAPVIFFLLWFGLWTVPGSAADSCVTCHAAVDDAAKGPAALIKNDVHIAHGLSCADCHGGDRTSDDPDVAMNKAKGFKGKPARATIPKFCATCHSSPDYMRKYAPRERVDQFELYQTSVHGKRLAAGDTAVATCIDCHSVHDIRAVKDTAAPVYPLRVAETCSRCHSDAQKMAPYKIPTNQFQEYKTSVHWEALTKRGDLSAPTCASCHGNHGAKPPQVESVSAVCGSCHVLFEQLNEKSVHNAVFSGAASGSNLTGLAWQWDFTADGSPDLVGAGLALALRLDDAIALEQQRARREAAFIRRARRAEQRSGGSRARARRFGDRVGLRTGGGRSKRRGATPAEPAGIGVFRGATRTAGHRS